MDKKKLKERILGNIATLTGVIDSINLSGIYSSYTSKVLMNAYSNTLQFVYLPITFCCSIIYAIIAWRTALLKRNRKQNGKMKEGYVVPAVVNTVSSLLLGTAVVLTCVAAVKFGVISTLFFGANLALNSFYYLGASLFYAGKAKATPEEVEMHPLGNSKELATSSNGLSASNCLTAKPISKKQEYKSRSIAYAIVGTISTLTAFAGFMTVLVGQKAFAWFGVAVGVVSACLGAVSLAHTIREEWKKSNEEIKRAEEGIVEEEQPEPADTLDIVAKLTGRQPGIDDLRYSNDNPQLKRTYSQPSLKSKLLKRQHDFGFKKGASTQEREGLLDDRPLARSSIY